MRGPGSRGPGRARGETGRDRPTDTRPPRSGPPGGKGRSFAKPERSRDDRPAREPVRAERDEAPEPAQVLPAEERIAKVIARAGIASRRDAEAMIDAGRVTLNGKAVTSPALNVGSEDQITVDGEALPLRERTRLWLFHKPRGLVTTFRDPQGRPTVFEALPEEMPRVVAIGRLDMNTEGLLLLTNDGGLAKVIAHPETGWTRRYRVRARGEVTQEQLDKLRNGITVDEMDYGPVEATLDRQQGDNTWLTLSLREGKNREVKRILEHLGLQVNRLIRLSFGPFQLGDLESGLVEEVKTKILRDQLGKTLATEAGVDFESPVREPIAPFGRSEGATLPGRPARMPEPRRASESDRPGSRPARYSDRAGGERSRPGGDRPGRPGGDRPGRPPSGDRPMRAGAARPARAGEERPARPDRFAPKETAWRASDQDGPSRPKRYTPREDPRADRAASAERPRTRVAAIQSGEGRRVLVERVAPAPGHDAGPNRRDGAGRRPRDEGGPPPRGRNDGEARERRPSRSFDGPRPDSGAGKRFGGGPRTEGRGGAGKSVGGKPGFGPRAGAGPKPAFGARAAAGGDRARGDGPPRGRPPGGGRPGGKPPFKAGPPRGGRPGAGPRGRES